MTICDKILEEKSLKFGATRFFHLDSLIGKMVLSAMKEHADQFRKKEKQLALNRCDCDVCDPTEIKVCTNCDGYIE